MVPDDSNKTRIADRHQKSFELHLSKRGQATYTKEEVEDALVKDKKIFGDQSSDEFKKYPKTNNKIHVGTFFKGKNVGNIFLKQTRFQRELTNFDIDFLKLIWNRFGRANDALNQSQFREFWVWFRNLQKRKSNRLTWPLV
eukprot:TRINITY_DN3731_c0_g1_i1.p1 TRINITY_DN3731_c0_g1~~TRINITY_DN3731_c0_g1_i1.p1  ORF type:complete len:141 (+),score=30.43 TRINITY_DN3731_c0_g1_i1:67-489(+)